MATIDQQIFRAYDIRGEAHQQLTTDACLHIAKAFGSTLRELYNKEHPTVVVGRDARTHGPEFEEAIINGLVSVGCHVKLIGQTPSPINYFTICNEGYDGGIQVTASHNPAKDNGLKLQVRDAEAFSGESLQDIKQRTIDENYLSGQGETEEIPAIETYTNYMVEKFEGVGEGKVIAVDSGNGVAGPVYCDILKKVGCTLEELYTEPDGTFPNHPADPSKWSTLTELQRVVVASQLDCGFAYDGDGDRVGMIDEKAEIKTADHLLLLLAKDHLQRNPNAPIVFTVSNSGTLITEVESWGGKPVMCKVGHSYVEHTMREHGSTLGGEQSGHFFCGEDYYDFDDALVTTLRILSILSDGDKKASELFSEFPKVFQSPEKRPFCPDDKKSEIIEKITNYFADHYPVETMDGARIDFGDGAWAGIRQSNTSPCISICIEARTKEHLEEVETAVYAHLHEYDDINFHEEN